MDIEAIAYLVVGGLLGHYVFLHYKRTGKPF